MEPRTNHGHRFTDPAGGFVHPSLVALNRFGLGARPGEARTLPDRAAAEAWLLGQVGGPSELQVPPGVTVPDRAAAGRALEGTRGPDVQEGRRRLQEIRTEESTAVLAARVLTDRPFTERLVAFWSNHLCVSFQGRLPVLGLAGLYEREVIRPHVYGRFSDMLLASARHPAMLLYLDNVRSVGPGSPVARLAAEQRARQAARPGAAEARPGLLANPGLNENYARELMELHTLGVDGGYTQADVEALARILTGWTVAGPGALPGVPGIPAAILRQGLREGIGGGAPEPGTLSFLFREGLHEPGAQTLLGKRYGARGEAKGEEAIRDLAAHPATARFLARKLAMHFVSDDPPEGAVEALAEAYRESEGDLAHLSRTLVRLDAPWSPEARKLRTPQEWTLAALRTGAAPAGAGPVATRPAAPNAERRIVQTVRGLQLMLQRLRHPLWGPPSPAGYGDGAREWSDPDSLMNRAELARMLAQRLGPVRNPEALAEVVPLDTDDPLRAFLSDSSIAPPERIALLLGGPAFQWR